MLILSTTILLSRAALIGILCAFVTSAIYAQASDEFPVPANIKTEGIPPIKKNDVDKLFFEPAQVRSNLIWDADRKNRSILVTDERSYIYRVDAPMASPLKVIDGRVPSMVRISPKGRVFAFTDDKEDADNFELYLLEGKSPARKLSTFSGKDESVESIVWDKKGEMLFYTQADYDSKTSKLCGHDLSVNKCFISDLKGVWYVIDANGNKVLLKYWKASSNQSLYIYDLPSKKLTAVAEEGNSPKGFFGQGRVFWLAEDAAECGSDSCLMSMELKTGIRKRILLPDGVGNIQDIKISPDGKSFLIHETHEGIDNLRIGRMKGPLIVETVKPFIKGSYVIWGTRWLSDKEVLYTTENIGKPASVESFDIQTKQTTVWTKERVPVQFEGKIRDPEVIRWKSFDERQISGFAVRPQTADKKSPVLIFIHGGPQIIDRPTFSSQDVRFIANLGITIIHTNIRGSEGFGNEFMDADNGARRGDAVKDISALINWIEKQPELDSDRIIVRGESYGGFIALAAALQEPHRIKAVLAEYPMVSIRGYLSQSWIDEFAINEYGDPKNESLMKKLDDLSPLNNVSRWNGTPLFLTRGKRDARVPEGDVVGLKSQLQDRGTEVWFIYDNEAGHGVGSRYVTAAMYEFLKKQIRRK